MAYEEDLTSEGWADHSGGASRDASNIGRMREELPRNTILLGDAREQLGTLPSASVDCVITSPPYFQLRDYGVAGQIGLEPSVAGWVANLRAVFAEVARVLTPTGALWLNLGDSFSRHKKLGAAEKSLLLAPERLLLALAQDGWIVRNKVVWQKTNPMPSSVADRLSATHEFFYLLVRGPKYFFDLDAVREMPRSWYGKIGRAYKPEELTWAGPLAASRTGLRTPGARTSHVRGKNPGDIWSLANRGYRGAHFAVFPPALVRRPILTTCPVRVCSACGLGWKSSDERWGCDHEVAPRPGVVLDPFFGSGTTGVVAQELGRDWLGIEINPAYVRLAEDRLQRAAEKAAAMARGGTKALAV